MFIIIIIASSVSAAYPSGLVSYWSFDNELDVGNDNYDGNDGTLIGGANYTNSGKVNGGTSYDGLNDHISMGDVISFERNDPFSISVWFKTSSTGVTRVLVSKRNYGDNWGYNLGIGSSSNQLFFARTHTYSPGVRDVVHDPTTAVTDGNWHHAVATSDGTDANGMKIYLDGSPLTMTISSNTLGSNTMITNAPFQIAAFDGGHQEFDGTLDEIAIFNRVLTPTEISDIYDLGVAGLGLEQYGNSGETSVIPEFSTIGTFLAIAIAAIGMIFLINKRK